MNKRTKRRDLSSLTRARARVTKDTPGTAEQPGDDQPEKMTRKKLIDLVKFQRLITKQRNGDPPENMTRKELIQSVKAQRLIWAQKKAAAATDQPVEEKKLSTSPQDRPQAAGPIHDTSQSTQVEQAGTPAGCNGDLPPVTDAVPVNDEEDQSEGKKEFTQKDRDKLERLKATVTRVNNAWLVRARSLRDIQENRYYELEIDPTTDEPFNNMEEFCVATWDFDRKYASQQVVALRKYEYVESVLSPRGDRDALPSSRFFRELPEGAQMAQRVVCQLQEAGLKLTCANLAAAFPLSKRAKEPKDGSTTPKVTPFSTPKVEDGEGQSEEEEEKTGKAHHTAAQIPLSEPLRNQLEHIGALFESFNDAINALRISKEEEEQCAGGLDDLRKGAKQIGEALRLLLANLVMKKMTIRSQLVRASQRSHSDPFGEIISLFDLIGLEPEEGSVGDKMMMEAAPLLEDTVIRRGNRPPIRVPNFRNIIPDAVWNKLSSPTDQ
jgi:hypothetical protein